MYTGNSPDAGIPAAGLLDARPSLVAWYATPLPDSMRADLQQSAEAGVQRCLPGCMPDFGPQLLRLVCCSLTGSDISGNYRQLAGVVQGARESALLELVYGQLLISRKRRPAAAHLERGLVRAAACLGTRDYFRLVGRHETLGYLALTDRGSAPQPLDSLLAEGAVIRCLRAHAGRHDANVHYDTVG